MTIPPIFTWIFVAMAQTPAINLDTIDLHYKECLVLYEKAVKSGVKNDMDYVRAVCSVRQFKEYIE